MRKTMVDGILSDKSEEFKRNIKEYFQRDYFFGKGKLFSLLIPKLHNYFFDKEKLSENFDKNIELIFIFQEETMNIFKYIEIPNDYFMLINSLFEFCKNSDKKKKEKFIEKIKNLFKRDEAYFFVGKFLNELFEILIYYSSIEQAENTKELALDELFERFIERNDIYLSKFEKLILEKSKMNQQILTKFILQWIKKIYSISTKKIIIFGNVFIDFMPWIMKTKNSEADKFGEDLKKSFLNFFDYINENYDDDNDDNDDNYDNYSNKKEEIKQIKNCIFSFIELVINQKEANQQEEIGFLDDLISKIIKLNVEIIKEIFPFDTFCLFLSLILKSKDINKNLNENLKELIKKVYYKNIKIEEFKDKIEEGINNQNFEQKKNALDWYFIIYEKNIMDERELSIILIKIILNYIDKNLVDKNNEKLFLLTLKNSLKDNILTLFEILSDCLINGNYNYSFNYKISGYLINFLIFTDVPKKLKESLSTPKNTKEDNDLLLFEKIFKIFSVNPMCLLIFFIYMEEYELGWELIMNFKNIKLEDDYYKYLAIFAQAIDNRQWNDMRLKILNPNKNIYFIKCLYGILMLLPQGKAFRILSDRLYSIKGLLKCKDNFDTDKNDDNINNKTYIKKYIEMFFNIQTK